MNQKTRFNVGFIAIAVLGVLLLQDTWARSQAVATIPYSQFQTLVKAQGVEKVLIGPDRIEGTLKTPSTGAAASSPPASTPTS